MSKQNRKRVVLAIVEGTSDKVSLENIFETFFDSNLVHVAITYGDITSKNGSSFGTILAKIGELIKQQCYIEKFQTSDILRIIHIIDTDGAFVSDSVVKEDMSLDDKKIHYENDAIYTNKTDGIKNRNARKKAILLKLLSTHKLIGKDYKIYFLSRNLEHVFHNDARDLTEDDKDEKRRLSNQFDAQYGDNFDAFKKFITDATFAVPGNYEETWNFIKQDCNSLKRYSNLHLLFTI